MAGLPNQLTQMKIALRSNSNFAQGQNSPMILRLKLRMSYGFLRIWEPKDINVIVVCGPKSQVFNKLDRLAFALTLLKRTVNWRFWQSYAWSCKKDNGTVKTGKPADLRRFPILHAGSMLVGRLISLLSIEVRKLLRQSPRGHKLQALCASPIRTNT